MDPLLLILIIMLPLLAFQFFYSGRKRKQQQEKRKKQIVPGANVMTSSGFFGKVISIIDEENKTVVEFAPGVEITIHTQAITTVADPQAESPADRNESKAGSAASEDDEVGEEKNPEAQEPSRN